MGYIVLYIAALALSIWVHYLVAREFYRAACGKGSWEKKYFWLPFLLGFVGYLLIIALPDYSKVGMSARTPIPGENLPPL